MKTLYMLIVVSACILSGCQSNSTEVNQVQVLEDILQNRPLPYTV